MSLRTVALETPRLWRSTRDLEPMGSLVATKSATMARNTSKRRSSALPIVHLPLVIWSVSILRGSAAHIHRDTDHVAHGPPRHRFACKDFADIARRLRLTSPAWEPAGDLQR